MFFKRTDNLTSNLTSYDLVKCMTVLFMFADHIGAYFIPEQLWWRVAGRLGFPAWFFLAGYSKSKGISTDLWIGAGILTFGNIMFGEYMFPANALVSFICIRIFMSHSYQIYFKNWEILLYATVAFAIMALPTNYLFEYGTLAFLLALFGYSARRKDELTITKNIRILFCVTVAITAAVVQIMTFGFNFWQGAVCTVTLSAMCFLFYHFKSAEYPELTQTLPKPVTVLIQFGGRYTLEIYVIHLMLIKIYLFWADKIGHYHWFSPTMFPSFAS
jgi:hypothetical protein